jgi:serine/threonine protein kinase/tetratricopeptide (TPR) repeat protein
MEQRHCDAIEDALEAFDNNWSMDSRHLLNAIQSVNCFDMPEQCAEFVRIDIDRRYAANLSVDLQVYFSLFPALSNSAVATGAIAYEDYRCRLTRNLSTTPDRWRSLPQITLQTWYRELLAETHQESPTTPRLGERFGDFLLVYLLGRGAFSEVYLAQQISLASRYVVVKIVQRALDEPTHLARMQHTGIVPLFSFHRIGQYSILCMPYTGVTTLQHWLGRTKKLSADSSRSGESFVETIQQSLRQITFHSREFKGSSSTAESVPPTPLFPAWPQDKFDLSPSAAVTQSGATHSNAQQDSFADWNSAASRPLQQLLSLDHRVFPVWFASRLAAALAHAHERGIVHGDLKPANILLRNDGEPALIDFNLAQDIATKQTEIVGGTLPYMAPEQLQALLRRQPTATPAADIFSFGVITYELLEGRLPFPIPASAAEIDVTSALARLQKTVPSWSTQSGTPGMRAIVEKCLSLDPKARYASAVDLWVDIEREANFLPLRSAKEPLFAGRFVKFLKRHPALASSSAISTVAAGVILFLSAIAYSWWFRSRELASAALVESLESALAQDLPKLIDLPTQQAFDQIQQLRDKLDQLGIPFSQRDAIPLNRWLSSPEEQRFREAIYEFALVSSFALLQHNAALTNEQKALVSRQLSLAQEFKPASHDPLDLLDFLQDNAARHLALTNEILFDVDAKTSQQSVVSSRVIDNVLRARLLLGAGDPYSAYTLLSSQSPGTEHAYLFWMTMGEIQLQMSQADTAIMSFTMAHQEQTESPIPLAARGRCQMLVGNTPAAALDYSLAIERAPENAEYWTLRANVHERTKDLQAALSDLNRALEIAPHSNRIRLIRYRVYQQMGRFADARSEFEIALHQPPSTIDDWVARALARAPSQPKQALDDLQNALKLDAASPLVLQNLAYIQSELLHDYQAAQESLDRLLELRPHHEMARGGRAVLLARLGDEMSALHDVEYLENNFVKLVPATLYQLSCVHALLSSQRESSRHESLKYLARALQRGYGSNLLDSDPDLAAIRDEAMFIALKQSVSLSATP